MHNRGTSRSPPVRTGRCLLFHFNIRISVQRDRSMPTAEAYLDAVWNFVAQFLYMMARINRDGGAVEQEALRERVEPSANVEREVAINVRDIV